MGAYAYPLPGTSLRPSGRPGFRRIPRNPEDLWMDEREDARYRGDQFDQDFRDRANDQLSQENWGREMARSQYAELLSNPGYSPEEREQILREAQMQGLLASEEDFQALGLTPDEITQIQGDPYGALNTHYNPQYYDSLGEESGRRLRESTGRYTGSLSDVESDAVDQLGGAIDPERLRQDPAYRDQVLSALQSGYSTASGAVGDDALGVSEDYMSNRGFTDQDVSRMGESASRDVGLRHQAALTDLERESAAAGYTDPMALAAARSRLLQSGAVGSADARMDAELAALNAQKSALQAREDTRLGAEQTQAGMISDVALGGSAQQAGALSDVERQRIGAEQGLSDRQLRRAGMESDIRRGIAGDIADVELGTERDIRDTALQGEQWKTGTALPATERAENRASGRSFDIANVRRDAAGRRIDTRYNQGMGVQDRLSDRQLRISDARRDDQREGRAFYVGQQDRGQRGYDTATGNRLDAWRISQGGSQAAAGGYADAYNARQQRPSVWGRIAGAGIGAGVGFLTGGPAGAAMGAAQGSGLAGGLGRTGGAGGYGRTQSARRLPAYDPSRTRTRPDGSLQVGTYGNRSRGGGGWGGWGGGFRRASQGLARFEHGGMVTQPTMALLGEAGPEMVVPLRRPQNSALAPWAPQSPSLTSPPPRPRRRPLVPNSMQPVGPNRSPQSGYSETRRFTNPAY